MQTRFVVAALSRKEFRHIKKTIAMFGGLEDGALFCLAQLVKALADPTHVRTCVQEVRVRSPEQTSWTLASIPPG